ncbi:MAG: TonB-dependent receptor [Bacteroidota bacterium]
MYTKLKLLILLVLISGITVLQNDTLAQTTGKISGSVVDAETDAPLPYANVMIEGTQIGAATDMNGDYYILNVSPGNYSLRVQMMGYGAKVVSNVVVSVNRTTSIDVSLSETLLVGEEVVVTAAKVSLKKDQTSSVQNVSAEQIEMLPVENLNQVVQMQAGVVDGHFRGGRLTEVAYLIDGMQVNEVFSGQSTNVSVETEAAQDLEVITGTFNAEYGKAMSGIVNVVTKEGGNNFKVNVTGYLSNYYTTHSDVFIGLSGTEVTRNQDYKLLFEGPIVKDYITFFTNFRYQDNKGHISGIRRFSIDDYTDFTTPNVFEEDTKWDTEINGEKYYSEHTGDNAFVPITTSMSYSAMGKLTFKLHTNLKLSFMGTLNYNEYQNTGHRYKYRPDGRATNYKKSLMYMMQINHFISNSAFHELKVSLTDNNRYSYLYEDPFDERYVHPGYSRGAGGFSSGGQDRGHSERYQDDLNVKYDLTWQITKSHGLKTGFLYSQYKIINNPVQIQNELRGTPFANLITYDSDLEEVTFYPYMGEYVPEEAISLDRYTKKPYEMSGYIQDKMEFDAMVINLGVRYDYFNSNTTYPSQRRNPANQLLFYEKDSEGNIIYDSEGNPVMDSERMSTYPEAPTQQQISPRFGLSYTLGQAAVLHFSYGHFFQMPPLSALYNNYRFLIPPGDFQTVHGNPEIKAEKTVQYEMGIWQELLPNMGLSLSVYYKDIYDLQSAIVYTTYNQIKYGLYSNKDYGNAKGFELKFDYIMGPLSIFLNYTLQYTRGNADNPTSTYSRAGASLDPVPYLVPMSWDQRHTANISLGYKNGNFGATLTGYFNSGKPYTYSPVSISPLAKQTLYPNNSVRPTTYTFDFTSHYNISIGEKNKLRLFLIVYNLLDRKNELSVNSSTGRAYTAVVYPVNIATFRSNYNDIYDSIQNPYMYSKPREIKVGIGLVL